MGVEGSSHPFLAFFDDDLPPEGATYTRALQITIECMDGKVPMMLTNHRWPRYGDYHPFSLDRKGI